MRIICWLLGCKYQFDEEYHYYFCLRENVVHQNKRNIFIGNFLQRWVRRIRNAGTL
mgnify:CR=1 FL=1